VQSTPVKSPASVASSISDSQKSNTSKNPSGEDQGGRTRTGFTERDPSSRQELNTLLRQVPERYEANVREVIQAPTCEVVPPASREEVSSIPELAKVGQGARVKALACGEKFLSQPEIDQGLKYYNDLREKDRKVWFGLIMTGLQSNRTPEDILGNDCNTILKGEWVIDYLRLDKDSRGDIPASSEGFFNRAEIFGAQQTLFDHEFSKITSRGWRVFEMAVNWWITVDEDWNENRDEFIQCLRRAGWAEAHSGYIEFVKWSIEFAPLPIRKACNSYFRWAYPRLLHALTSEGNAKRLDL
jgi:hypothetical protein